MKCVSPILIKNKNYTGKNVEKTGTYYKYVPCGKCIACRAARAKEWVVRLLYEAEKWHGKCSFLTLTYDDDHVPTVDWNGEKIMTLRYEDIKDFFKRFRYYFNEDFSYYCCSEYGSETFRPHYHAILFGVPISALKAVQDAWNLGFVQLGTCELKSIRYVCGYVQKKVKGFLPDDFFDCPDREQMKQRQSKGLSLDYLIKYKDAISQRPFITVNGVKQPIPRYFLKKLGICLSEGQTKEELAEKLRTMQRDVLQAKQREANLIAKREFDKLKKAYSHI